MTNFSAARRCFREGAKGVEGGASGVSIGGGFLRRGLGFGRRKRWTAEGGAVLGRDAGPS
jgi:hypothetical protein